MEHQAQSEHGDGHKGNGAAAPEPEGWSVNRLARELRLDRRTVSARLHSVAPIGEGPKGPVYSLADAARALFGGTTLSEIDELKVRSARANAERSELQLSEIRGELVRAAEVRTAAERNARQEREALLNWPDRITPTLAAELGVDQSRLAAALERELRTFMEERADDDGAGV